MDSLGSFAKLELLKWPKNDRKKKLCDIFPPADSEIWKNYDQLEAAALSGKSEPPSSSSAADSVASSSTSADNNALKDAMEQVAESVASQASKVKSAIKFVIFL